MKILKQDRRSERTRRLIADALVALLHERHYADITVQDLLDRANIGRSTFYAQYWDKDDLLTSEMERVVELFIAHDGHAPDDTLRLLPSLGLYRHIREEQQLYRAVVRGQGNDLILRILNKRLCERVEERLQALLPATTKEILLKVTAQAVVGTFLALLQWWMESEIALRPEEIDAYFRRLALPGVQQILSQPQ